MQAMYGESAATAAQDYYLNDPRIPAEQLRAGRSFTLESNTYKAQDLKCINFSLSNLSHDTSRAQNLLIDCI